MAYSHQSDGAAVDIGERRQANILVLAPVGRIDNLTSAEFQARLLVAVTSSAAAIRNTVRSAYSGSPDGSRLIASVSPRL